MRDQKSPLSWKTVFLATAILVLVTVGVLAAQGRLAMVAEGARMGLTPFVYLGKGVVSLVTRPAALLHDMVSMSKEEKQLQADVTQLRLKNIQLQESLLSLQRMQKLLTVPPPVGCRLIPASIRMHEPTNYVKGAFIDRGTADGVLPTMVVVTDDGVVGRVLSAGHHDARLLFLLDPNCRVSVVDERSRVMGVAVGTGGSRCDMLYVPSDEDIQAGDRLLTSGKGGVFPKGLPVGRVMSVERSPNGILLSVSVEPFVKFSRIEEVMVAVPQGPR